MRIILRIVPVCITVSLISGCAQDTKIKSYQYSGHTVGFLNSISSNTYRFFIDKRYVEIDNYHKEDNSTFYPSNVVSTFETGSKTVSFIEGKSDICSKRYEIVVFDSSNIINSKYIGYCSVS